MTTKREPAPSSVQTTDSPDAVARARAEVDRLHRIERDWSTKLRAKQRELLELESSAGEEVLAAINAGTDESSTVAAVSARSAAVRSEVLTIDRTVAAARAQRLASIPLVWKAEAAILRERAGPLLAEAAAIAVRRDEHLAQLMELEGARFIVPSRDFLAAAFSGAVGPEIVYYQPKSEQLLARAHVLRDQAARLESTQVVMAGGTPELADLDALIAAATGDPMTMGPRVSDIEQWFASANARGQEQLVRRERQTGRERARLYFSIAWQDGTLDRPNCKASIRGLGPVVTEQRRNMLDDSLEDPTETVVIR